MTFGWWRGARFTPPAVGVLAAVLALGAAACGPTPPTASPPTSGFATASATASPPPATADPTASGSSASESQPTLPAGVIVDPGLLDVLPAQIDDVTLQPDPATAAQVAGDPLLAESALSIAVALAIDQGPSGSEDLAVASVIRLRPGIFDEAFYQEWRDTYDDAACEVADGVQSTAQTEIGGRTTYVGTCVGAAQTYHVYLEDQGFIVSITAVGERVFGELILAGLAG